MRNWTEYLDEKVYTRLCNCRTIKADVGELVKARWRSYQENGKATQGFTKEDALVSILELLDANSCYIDLTIDEYNDLCR